MTGTLPGALDGIRVVEIASVVLGPYACQMLGDLGADVVKVEPLFGDSNRRVGPSGAVDDLGAFFVGCNRNKRSLAVDLKHPDGLAAALELVRRADVLVHNFRPRAMQRLGLEYDAVAAVNPRIVYCATHGYSLAGPYGERGAFDDSIQAASGLAALQHQALGEMHFLPTIVADKTTAMLVAQSIVAALFHRERTGQGQSVEVPMFETMTAWTAVEHLWDRTWAGEGGQCGYPRVMSKWRRPYRTADDRYLAILPYWDNHWKTFAELSGHPELADDARFTDLPTRLAHIDECYGTVERVIAERCLDDWLALFSDSCVPVMPVNSLDDLLGDPHLEAIGFWQWHEHPDAGPMRLAAPAARFSASPASIRRVPPRLGEHSREVLEEAGLDSGTVDRLLEDGVVRAPTGRDGDGHGG